MDFQMAKKSLTILQLKTKCNLQNINDSVDRYCGNLFFKRSLSEYFIPKENTTIYHGKCTIGHFDEKFCKFYTKCTHKNEVFHSIYYKRDNLRDETIVKYNVNHFGRIHKIMKLSDNCFLQ